MIISDVLIAKLKIKDDTPDTREAIKVAREAYETARTAWDPAYARHLRPAIETACAAVAAPSRLIAALFARNPDAIYAAPPRVRAKAKPQRANTSRTSGRNRRKATKITRDDAQLEKEQHLDELLADRIPLPSALRPDLLTHPALRRARSVERQLREGQANEALEMLRFHLATKFTIRELRERIHNQDILTRTQTRLSRKEDAIRQEKDRYRTIRELLLALGMSNDDPVYKPLRDSEVTMFTVVSEQNRLSNVGKQPSWLWENFSFVEKVKDGKIKKYLETGEPVRASRVLSVLTTCVALKAHWFRRKALTTRLGEHVALLKEEMTRTAATYRYYERWWQHRAKNANRACDASHSRR